MKQILFFSLLIMLAASLCFAQLPQYRVWHIKDEVMAQVKVLDIEHNTITAGVYIDEPAKNFILMRHLGADMDETAVYEKDLFRRVISTNTASLPPTIEYSKNVYHAVATVGQNIYTVGPLSSFRTANQYDYERVSVFSNLFEGEEVVDVEESLKQADIIEIWPDLTTAEKKAFTDAAAAAKTAASASIP